MEDYYFKYCKENGIINNVLFAITEKCNLKCKHCIVGENRLPEIPFETAVNIIDKLFIEGTIYVSLTGGEPLLHSKFVDIYTYLKVKGFIVDIKTNGLLINENIINLFNKYPPNKIAITAYGLNNEDYRIFTGDRRGFDKLDGALTLLEEAGLIFKMTIVANKLNFKSIVNHSYHHFFKRFGIELEFDYDILNTNSGSTQPLQYRLTPEEIISIEVLSDNYFKPIRDKYMNSKNSLSGNDASKFTCSGGLVGAYIDVIGNIHICYYDHEISYSIESLDWSDIKSYLISRNDDIHDMHHVSKCFNCHMDLGCNKCPLLERRRSSTENINEKCEIADLRSSFVDSSKYTYSLNIPNEANYTHLNLPFTVNNWGVSDVNIDDSYLFHDLLTSVTYNLDGLIVDGNIGKSVFYIPVLNQDVCRLTNISAGRGLKIIKYLETNNYHDQNANINKLFELNQRLYRLGVSPNVYQIIIINNPSPIKIFHKNRLYEYPAESKYFAIEVEHLLSQPLDPIENTFAGVTYKNDKLIQGIIKYLAEYGIIPDDLGTQNLINTCDGIKLIDFWDWLDEGIIVTDGILT